MAGAAEGEAGRRPSEYPRDLLRQFSGGIFVGVPEEPPATASAATEEDSDEIELSLGLSLGGCFGVDPARKRGLHRSSSISAIPILRQGEPDPAAAPLPLKRTSSLPAEAEEQQRKRKELQCLRRMEAKRKRSEKAGGPRAWAADPAASPEQEGRSESEQLPRGWWAPNGEAAAAWRGSGAAAEGTRCFAAGSQGSVGSQGSSSSRVSDFGRRLLDQQELLGNGTDRWRRLSRTQSLPDLTEHNTPAVGKPMTCAAGRVAEVEDPSPGKQPAAAGISGGNGMSGVTEDMPWVSTRGSGPNGRRVEGFLYRYGKGEEVRIVCVCHGRFLSPAEFVRHAGGGDVDHPLRHIMVNPGPSGLS